MEDKILELISKGESLAPELIEKFINWRIIMNEVAFIFFTALFVSTLIVFLKSKFDNELVSFICIMVMLMCIMIMGLCMYSLIQLYYIPEVYIIDYFTKGF